MAHIPFERPVWSAFADLCLRRVWSEAAEELAPTTPADADEPAAAAEVRRPHFLDLLVAHPSADAPDDAAEENDAGGDPVGVPQAPEPEPSRSVIPVPRLSMTLRLCATFVSLEAMSAVQASGAITLLSGFPPQHLDPLMWSLKNAVLPRNVQTASSALGLVAGGPRLLLLAPHVDSGKVSASEAASFVRRIEEALDSDTPVLILLPDGVFPPRDLVDLLPAPRPLAPLGQDIVLEHLRVSHPFADADCEAAVRAALPADRALAALNPRALGVACREVGAIAAARKLAALVPAAADRGPSLDEIDGYGEAEAVARRMVDDLRAWSTGRAKWSEITRSLLLYGPPGAGKSWLAKAIGNSSGATFIQASCALWQSHGHLGDMLGAMRRTRSEALGQRPTVLFIEEIDAFGSRSERGNNSNYTRQVIDALLEMIDDLVQAEGVLLVGACNDIAALDPAIRRPGRFDVTAEVALPGAKALARILRLHLPPATTDPEIETLARAAVGRSAADVDAAIRSAKTLARAGQREFRIDDVRAGLAPAAGDTGTPDWRVAIHECGHAIVAAHHKLGAIHRLILTPTGGEIQLLPARNESRRQDIEARIEYVLGGRAAERLVFSEASGGSGGPAHSDLAQATRLAVAIDANLGLGEDGPVWSDGPQATFLSRPEARARIRARLEAAEDRAMDLLAHP